MSTVRISQNSGPQIRVTSGDVSKVSLTSNGGAQVKVSTGRGERGPPGLPGNLAIQGTQISILPGVPETNITINTATTVFTGNVIPSSNNTLSLGSPQSQWKSLFISNNTIYIDNVPVSVSNNTLLVNNAPVVTVDPVSNTIVANGVYVTANTGNITFANDTIGSTTGNINVSSFVSIDNSLYVSGDISLDGNLIIGNKNTDTVNVIADFSSDLIPAANNAYKIGSDSKQWQKVHVVAANATTVNTQTLEVVSANVQNLQVATANIQTVNLSGDLVATNSSTLKVGGTTTVNTSYISANVIISGPTETTYNVFTTNADSPIVIDSFPSPDFTTVKYIIQSKSVNGYHATELFCMQDGIEAYLTEYATLINNYTLGSYTLTIQGGNCYLYFNPNNPDRNIITVKLVRTALTS